ncbi:MAG TPA: DUF1360 domain-containing protein [Solirubrobacteraceae bacterium]|nr:DUF1360 domain-containing protein [Solirubrobacteraceae bacterium]
MTHSAVLLILDALAVARLTRLLTADVLTAPMREKLAGRAPAQTMSVGGERVMVAARPRLAQFITCPWCTSPYLAIGVIVLQVLSPPACLYVTAVLAFSMVAGLLAERS